jgi:ectoine hydroxylase-related dioxygenase (phytanoyl-CoA dioxygenase family)
MFDEQGFVIWPRTIEKGLLDSLVASVEAIQRNAQAKTLTPALDELLVYEKDLSASKRAGVDGALTGDSIFIVGDPVRFDEVFAETLRDAALVAAATTLLGVDEAVVHFMNVTIKNPRFGRSIAWHRDYPNGYFCTRDSSFVRLMICLDGMSVESGATCFDAGTHRISDQDAQQQKVNGNWPSPDPANTVTVQCGPGHIVAIHPKVLHGGGMNTGSGTRRNLILQIGRPGAEAVTQATESLTGIVIGAQGCRDHLNR